VVVLQSHRATLRRAGYLLSCAAGLRIVLGMTVWWIGPNQPFSVMAPSGTAFRFIWVVQALFLASLDFEGVAIVVLVLSYEAASAASPFRCSSPSSIHREKVERLVGELEARGLDRSTIAPGLFRLLWALGARIPPPLFLGFTTLMLIWSVAFGGITVLSLLLFVGSSYAFWLSAVVGLLSGSVMAVSYCREAKTLSLGPWEAYGHTPRV
jgi:hypothetical protein